MTRLYVVLASFLFVSSFSAQLPPPVDEGIRWMSLEEAMSATKKAPRKIYIDLYTDWCGWCKVMDRKTFTNADVINHMNTNYYAVKLNGEQREDIQFEGKTFRFVPTSRGGYQEFAVFLTNGELSYPMSVFLDEDLNLLTRIPGFQSPEKMTKILSFFGEEHYKRTSWEEFNRL